MPGMSGSLTSKVVMRLASSQDGINARVTAIQEGAGEGTLSPIRDLMVQNASVDVSEKGGNAQYPALLVYCEKLANTMREKFRTFSGKVTMAVEVRYSQDHLDYIESRLQVYVDAVCALLDDSRGDWRDGAFYAGGYEVAYEPVIKGGRNFLQRAKVKFEVEVSR